MDSGHWFDLEEMSIKIRRAEAVCPGSYVAVARRWIQYTNADEAHYSGLHKGLDGQEMLRWVGLSASKYSFIS